MEFLYYDRNGIRVNSKELENFALWNPVMEHILAEVLNENAREKVPLADENRA